MKTEPRTQPQKGDGLLFCSHGIAQTPAGKEIRGHLHWFALGEALPFRRPDGTEGRALWIACCEDCFVSCKGDPLKIHIGHDGTWVDDRPLSYVDEN